MNALEKIRSRYFIRRATIALNNNSPAAAGEELAIKIGRYRLPTGQHKKHLTLVSQLESAINFYSTTDCGLRDLGKLFYNIHSGRISARSHYKNLSYLVAFFSDQKAATEEKLLDAYSVGPDALWDCFVLPSSLDDPQRITRRLTAPSHPRLPWPDTNPDHGLDIDVINSTISSNTPDLYNFKSALCGWLASLEYYVKNSDREVERVANRHSDYRMIENRCKQLLQSFVSFNTKSVVCDYREICESIGELIVEIKYEEAVNRLSEELNRHTSIDGITPEEILRAAWDHAWSLLQQRYGKDASWAKSAIEYLHKVGEAPAFKYVITNRDKQGVGRGNKVVEFEQIMNLKSKGLNSRQIAEAISRSGQKYTRQAVDARLKRGK